MKTAAALSLLLAACAAAPDAPVTARYVEARSAAVFAGPCHVNGEYDSQGRDALVGLRVESGAWDGQDLAGVELVAAVSSGANLAQGAPRRATLWVDAGGDAARARAAAAWLAAAHGAALGALDVRTAEVAVELDGERYRVEVPGACRLEGGLLPDRACCSMPEAVWYGPVLPAAGELVVGHSEACRVEGPGAWTYQRQNNALVGTLR